MNYVIIREAKLVQGRWEYAIESLPNKSIPVAWYNEQQLEYKWIDKKEFDANK